MFGSFGVHVKELQAKEPAKNVVKDYRAVTFSACGPF